MGGPAPTRRIGRDLDCGHARRILSHNRGKPSKSAGTVRLCSDEPQLIDLTVGHGRPLDSTTPPPVTQPPRTQRNSLSATGEVDHWSARSFGRASKRIVGPLLRAPGPHVPAMQRPMAGTTTRRNIPRGVVCSAAWAQEVRIVRTQQVYRICASAPAHGQTKVEWGSFCCFAQNVCLLAETWACVGTVGVTRRDEDL